MSWVNLNDVYVNKTGGTITGDLTVNGSIKVNDGKGDGGIYNVANEITTLRDSVSQDTGWAYLYPKDEYKCYVRYRVIRGICYIEFFNIWGIAAKTWWYITNKLPTEYCPTEANLYFPGYLYESNNTAGIFVGKDGRVGFRPETQLYSGGHTDCPYGHGMVAFPIGTH